MCSSMSSSYIFIFKPALSLSLAFPLFFGTIAATIISTSSNLMLKNNKTWVHVWLVYSNVCIQIIKLMMHRLVIHQLLVQTEINGGSSIACMFTAACLHFSQTHKTIAPFPRIFYLQNAMNSRTRFNRRRCYHKNESIFSL